MEMRSSLLVTAMLILLACLMSTYVYAQSPNEIEIRDFPFLRDALTVPYGTEVIWVNDDTIDHTVTCDDGTFHSGNLAPGKQFSYLFDRPGNYRYHCQIHPSEQGMIQVTSKPYSELFTSSKTQATAVSSDVDKTQSKAISKIHPSEQGMVQATSKQYSELFTSSKTQATAVSSDMDKTQSKDIGKIQSKAQSETKSKTQITDFQGAQRGQTAPGPTTTAHITAPEKCEICDMDSTAQVNLASLHVQDQKQTGLQSQYQAYAAQSKGSTLWIKGDKDWTKSAAVPQGSQLSLIAICSKEGSGYLYEKYPDGHTTKDDYYFFPYSQLGFYADTVGQHILSFSVDDQTSNLVVVDVIDYNAPASKQIGYQAQNYQQQNYQQQNYQQQNYQQQSQQIPSYGQQGYSQPNYNVPSKQLQLVTPPVGPSAEYNSFWEKSAVKMDGSGRLFLEGIQGTDYDLQPSNANLLTRGIFYNGVSYVLVANPYGTPNTIVVNPQMANWRMPNTEVMYGELTLAQADNLLQITVPAYQSGLIIIQPQKKRYSFSVGPKPPSSFKAGSKQVYSSSGGVRQPYSFNAGPKPPYSFRIGY